MDDQLRVVKTTKKPLIAEVVTRPKITELAEQDEIKSSEEALRILREEPTASDLCRALAHLKGHATPKTTTSAEINHTLVDQIIPTWWPQLSNDKNSIRMREVLLEILREVTSVGAIISRIKVLTVQSRDKSTDIGDNLPTSHLQTLLDVISAVLEPQDVLTVLMRKIRQPDTDSARQTALWKEAVSLTASGRILSCCAEAAAILNLRPTSAASWLSKGDEFTKWLARTIAHMIGEQDVRESAIKNIAELLNKSLTLGYQDVLVSGILEMLPLRDGKMLIPLKDVLKLLPAYQQRRFLISTLHSLDRRFLRTTPNPGGQDISDASARALCGCASLIQGLIEGNDLLADYTQELCIKLEDSALIASFILKRALISCLATDEDRLTTLLEKCLAKFGDDLFVRHAPVVQQEASAQMLLLSSGYVQRRQPMLLFTIAKSSTQTQGMSNRLKAASERARWLGMIVGMTLSELTDKPGARLKFEDDELDTAEALGYRSMVKVDDRPSSVEELIELRKATEAAVVVPTRMPAKAQKAAVPVSSNAKNMAIPATSRIVELLDDDEDVDDIVPYADPDSDPEDEDEDPTLVERNKPKAPVYIRGLMAGLRDTENYNRHRVSLETAASLIRRKINFGKEVSDHALELAAIFTNLNDHFEMENFLDLRQQALIALVVAQPKVIPSYLSRACFENSYSLQQKSSMLAALALGARELAGFKDAEQTAEQFPSKELPPHLRQIYSKETPTPLARVSGSIEQAMIEPMALQAADQMSGPNALKVRTFSSRMEVEKKRKKPITNQLAKDVAENFFFPLVAGWWAQMQSFSSRSVTFSGHLLPIYLRTLAVVLHASGPSTLSLPQMTSELWDLLFSLRSNALHDNETKVLESLLFAFLTLIDLNEDKRRLANEHAKELVETQEWAKLVLDSYASGDPESEKIRTLAAAVVVRCHEVVEQWQRLMLGGLVDV